MRKKLHCVITIDCETAPPPHPTPRKPFTFYPFSYFSAYRECELAEAEAPSSSAACVADRKCIESQLAQMTKAMRLQHLRAQSFVLLSVNLPISGIRSVCSDDDFIDCDSWRIILLVFAPLVDTQPEAITIKKQSIILFKLTFVLPF